MTDWLKGQPAWRKHPVNPSGSVSGHRGAAILSEHDCVLQYARFLHKAGVPWDDLHIELSPGQWMFPVDGKKRPPRIDLVIVKRSRLEKVDFPVSRGEFAFDAVYEFKLASNYWQWDRHGEARVKSKPPNAEKLGISADVAKVEKYLESGLAKKGYVIVVEECDHGHLVNDQVRDGATELRIVRAY